MIEIKELQKLFTDTVNSFNELHMTEKNAVMQMIKLELMSKFIDGFREEFVKIESGRNTYKDVLLLVDKIMQGTETIKIIVTKDGEVKI